MSHSLQGVYAPLPQSLSDSDSEKEISMEPIFANYGNNVQKSGAKHNLSCPQNGHLFNDDTNKVKHVKPKMSSLRKTAFVFSILLCFLPVIIFLWILPCSDSNTCPMKISDWESQQNEVEFKGEINLVQGAFKSNLNLALMYKGSFNTPKPLKNGVISFMGRSGAIAWDFRQESYPLEMNCTLIDADGNGVNDCLVIDERGLKVIETLSGEAIWHAHSTEDKSIPQLDMPVKLEDFDNDGVSELLSIYKRSTFFLISGKTGKVLANIKINSVCSSMESLQIVNDNIRYKCVMPNETQVIQQITFSDVKLKFLGDSKSISPKWIQQEETSNIFVITGNRKLSVEIHGQDPHCNSKLTLLDDKNSVIKTWSYQNTFVMTPIPFHLEYPSVAASDGYIKGFIFKIWQWQETPKKLSPTIRIHRRSLPVFNETYYLNEISERVVLIAFHDNDTHIINVSMTDVYVICKGPHADCQPDYKNQQKSLLIADLDHDNSLELISYYSSYVKKEENDSSSWYLMSKVNVFRLENELPKLYHKNK